MNAKKCKALRKMAKDMATNNLLSQETSYSEKIVKNQVIILKVPYL